MKKIMQTYKNNIKSKNLIISKKRKEKITQNVFNNQIQNDKNSLRFLVYKENNFWSALRAHECFYDTELMERNILNYKA